MNNQNNTSTATSQEHANQSPMNQENHIKCGVNECRYHGQNDICSASMITVSPSTPNCVTQEDTSCATFER